MKFQLLEAAGRLLFTQDMRRKYPDNPDCVEPMRFVASEQLREVVVGLLGLGYREEDPGKILGGNHLRIAREVCKAPRGARGAPESSAAIARSVRKRYGGRNG